MKTFKIGLAIALSSTLMGCAGYVGVGAGDGGGGVEVVEPGPYIYGDVYDRGGDVRAYSHRGFESRGIAHGGGAVARGGAGVAHGGGGGRR